MRIKILVFLILCVVLTGFSQTQKKIEILGAELKECETCKEENTETDLTIWDQKKGLENQQAVVALGGCPEGEDTSEDSTGISYCIKISDIAKLYWWTQVFALTNIEVRYIHIWRYGTGEVGSWTSDWYNLKKNTCYWFSVWEYSENLDAGVCLVKVIVETKTASSGSGTEVNYCVRFY